MERLAQRLYLLFTPELCRAAPPDTLRAALAGGVDLVQWRAIEARPRAELVAALEICGDADVPLIVNDDPELAVAVGAAGAHVGQDDMPAAAARAVLGPDRWLGVSTHDVPQIQAAERDGADHLGFGPCFPTATKGYREGQTDEAIAGALVATDLPVFAIGGIDADNVGRLVALGVRRIAVSRAILAARDPERAARQLAAALGV